MKMKTKHLAEEPQQRPVAGVGALPHVLDAPRRVPAAEEQRGRERRHGRQVDVLGEEEQRELQAGVLGVEAADQLALGLGEVEGGAVGLADHRDHVDDERRQQDQAEPQRVLRGDDLRRRHRAGVEEDRDEREAHRDLVGDHLRARAQAAEQGVRRAARTSRRARCRRCRSRRSRA